MQHDDQPAPGAVTVGVLGIPWDEHSSFLRGAAGAPPYIRRALHSEARNRWELDGFRGGKA